MSVRTCFGLVAAMLLAFAATPAFAVYTGVTVTPAPNAQELGSMTITLPGQQPVPVQESKTDDQKKVGAYFIDTSQTPKVGESAIIGYTDDSGRHHTGRVLVGDNGFVIDLGVLANAGPSSSATGTNVEFQVRGFGGVAFEGDHTPAKFGFDFAMMFPLGDGLLVGPMAGYERVNDAVVAKVGPAPPPSTFIIDSAKINAGTFGGRIEKNLGGGWLVGAEGGAIVARVDVTQQEGFCSPPGGSRPPGCQVFGTASGQDTRVAPFGGAYIERFLCPHVAAFAEYEYSGLDEEIVSGTGPSQSTRKFDLNQNEIKFGVAVRLPPTGG
jgi:hypothetical protein